MRRHQVLIRVRTALMDLEMLPEAKAMRWDTEAISRGKSDGNPPNGHTPTVDRFVRLLEEWCAQAEKAVMTERKGRKPDAKPEEIEYRILHDYVGRHHQIVAEALGVDVSTVSTVRKNNGWDRVYGTTPI